jgi:RNA polymerase sigma-70 factor, ECF subfamily
VTVTAAGPDRTELWEQLYHQNYAPLYAYSLKLTLGDVAWAEDLVQETMMRAWQNIDHLELERAAARPWLFTVVKRIMIDGIRARAARPAELSGEHLEWSAAAEEHADRTLTSLTVRRVLAALPAHHRCVLAHLYLAERTTEETAELLGIPPGTVKSRAFYALRSARRAMEELRG